MGDSVSRACGNSHLELLEVISDCGILFPRSQFANCFDLQSKSTTGQVRAEYQENRCPGEDSQFGPNCEEALVSAKKQPGARIGADPGDISIQIDSQSVAEGSPRTKYAFDGNCWRQIAAQEHFRLRMGIAFVKLAIKLARDMSGALDEQSNWNPSAKQPMHSRNVGSQVTANQDCPSATGEGCRQPLKAVDVEAAQYCLVGLAIDRVITREKIARYSPPVQATWY